MNQIVTMVFVEQPLALLGSVKYLLMFSSFKFPRLNKAGIELFKDSGEILSVTLSVD